MTELAQSIRSHLETEGYTFSQHGESQTEMLGKHATKPIIVLRPHQNGVLITAAYGLKVAAENDPTGFLRFLNEGNETARVARFVWREKDEGLFVEAWYPAAYDKAAFAEFFRMWLEEFGDYVVTHEEVGRRYLE